MIRSLDLDVSDEHVTVVELDPLEVAAARAREAAARDLFDTEVRGPLERHIFDPSSPPLARWSFIHAAGKEVNVTTTLATVTHHGECYHGFAENHSLDSLQKMLQDFLESERAYIAASQSARTPLGVYVRSLAKEKQNVRVPVLTLRSPCSPPHCQIWQCCGLPWGHFEYFPTFEHRRPYPQIRETGFILWNACVEDNLLLGRASEASFNRTAFRLNLKHHGESSAFPELFTAADVGNGDIALDGGVAALLGRFVIFSGRGEDLNADRAFVRANMDQITASTNRFACCVRRLHIFAPCLLLEGGRSIVDAPGSGDSHPLRKLHLKAAVESADHVILVVEKSAESESELLNFAMEEGLLGSLLDPNATKSVSVLLLRRGRARPAAPDEEEKDPVMEVHLELSRRLDGDELACEKLRPGENVLEVIQKRVQVVEARPVEYAALKMFPLRTANLSADELEARLRSTGGTKLIGMFEGLATAQSADIVERLQSGALKPFLTAGAADAPQPAADASAVAAVHARMEELLQPVNPGSTKGKQAASVRDDLVRLFDEEGDESPRSILREEMRAAMGRLCVAVAAEVDARKDTMLTRWTSRLRPHFVLAATANRAARQTLLANASLSHKAAGDSNKPPPKSMDLDSLLQDIAIPKAALNTFFAESDAALRACEAVCVAIVVEQLIRSAGHSADSVLMLRLLGDFGARSAKTTHTNATDKALSNGPKLTPRVLQCIFEAAKRDVLAAEIGVRAPAAPTPLDPSGVAALVDTRLDALRAQLKVQFEAALKRRVEKLRKTVEAALKPVPRGSGKRDLVTGMEATLLLGYGRLKDGSAPNAAGALATRAAQIAEAREDVRARMQRVLDNLRAAAGDAEALGRALERRIEEQAAVRAAVAAEPDAADFGRIDRLCDKDMPLPQRFAKANVNAPGGEDHFYRLLMDTRADPDHMAAVRAALAARRPRALADVAPPPGVAPARSLWWALAHQLFDETERTPAVLCSAVCAYIRAHYGRTRGGPQRFLHRHGAPPEQYAAELAAGARPAGVFELVIAVSRYPAQVLVYCSASPPGPPLLVFNSYRGAPHGPDRPPMLTAFTLVLESGAAAFRSTAVSAEPRGVAFGANTVHTFHTDEPRGTRQVPSRRGRDGDDGGGPSGVLRIRR